MRLRDGPGDRGFDGLAETVVDVLLVGPLLEGVLGERLPVDGDLLVLECSDGLLDELPNALVVEALVAGVVPVAVVRRLGPAPGAERTLLLADGIGRPVVDDRVVAMPFVMRLVLPGDPAACWVLPLDADDTMAVHAHVARVEHVLVVGGTLRHRVVDVDVERAAGSVSTTLFAHQPGCDRGNYACSVKAQKGSGRPSLRPSRSDPRVRSVGSPVAGLSSPVCCLAKRLYRP